MHMPNLSITHKYSPLPLPKKTREIDPQNR